MNFYAYSQPVFMFVSCFLATVQGDCLAVASSSYAFLVFSYIFFIIYIITSVLEMNLAYFENLKRKSTKEIIRWLQRRSLIADPLFCGDCNANMSLIARTSNHIDGYVWKCNKCRKKRSLRCNSIFALIPKISLGVAMLLIYHWAQGYRGARTATALGLSKNVVCKFFKLLEEVCSRDIEKYQTFLPFGGPECIVQCDESKFNHKRKYNRGRTSNEVWVFGVITTEYRPARGYYQVVSKRDRNTLLPILRKCLKPGSTIHTDDWGAYDHLETHLPGIVTTHRVVNHSLNFVDPVTGVNTQAIESKWNLLKSKLKERMGVSREQLQTYLNMCMYREWKGSGKDLLVNLFSSISLLYPNVSV